MAKRDELTPPPKQGLIATARKVAKAVGDATGIGAAARTAVDLHDATIDRLAQLARDNGVSEPRIEAALRVYDRAQKAQSLVALMLPMVPNVVLLRALAGAKLTKATVSSEPSEPSEPNELNEPSKPGE